jgi:hypothetical protein
MEEGLGDCRQLAGVTSSQALWVDPIGRLCGFVGLPSLDVSLCGFFLSDGEATIRIPRLLPTPASTRPLRFAVSSSHLPHLRQASVVVFASRRATGVLAASGTGRVTTYDPR